MHSFLHKAFPGIFQVIISNGMVPKSEGYLNRSFPGVKKGGVKGEVKRGEVVGK